MNTSLVKRVEELEKKVAALEGQVQAQPDNEFLNYIFQCIINYQHQMSKQIHPQA